MLTKRSTTLDIEFMVLNVSKDFKTKAQEEFDLVKDVEIVFRTPTLKIEMIEPGKKDLQIIFDKKFANKP